jgi:succinate dehydrogenase/fumarate reductase cytochrome b subunit
MAEPKVQIERPLSPHLGIYRFSITMAMSIVHRITGSALYFGTLLLVWGLLVRPACALRLHLGASAPHARRHSPFYLGHGARP